MLVEGVLVLLLLLLWLYSVCSRSKGMPPGPRCYPVVGSLNNVNDIPTLKDMQKSYGDIFSCQMGSARIVYLCNFKIIKEAFAKMEVSDRPHWKCLHFMTDGKEAGVVMSNGQRWINARRFLLSNLRDLGMGKSFLDEAILQEAQMLVEEFRTKAGGFVRLPNYTNIAVVNIIWQMVASCRYNLHDDEIVKFIKMFSTLHEESRYMFLPDIFPCLKILPNFVYKKLLKLDVVERIAEASTNFMRRCVESHKSSLVPSNPRDVIDKYLLQMSEKTDIAEYFSESDLMKIILDLFGAGFDTTSRMLQWVLLYMAKNPEMQSRAQQQIDDVVPRDTLPTNHHKNQLPYVEAIIHEALRIVSFAPLGIFHATGHDVHLAGYFIPKDTMVFGVTAICHEDPKYWEDPHAFKPERFLDSEGHFVSQREGFLPFGIGRRSCLGEALARMELSLFTAALLQNFTFAPPQGREVDLCPQPIPLVRNPREQDLLITVRK